MRHPVWSLRHTITRVYVCECVWKMTGISGLSVMVAENNKPVKSPRKSIRKRKIVKGRRYTINYRFPERPKSLVDRYHYYPVGLEFRPYHQSVSRVTFEQPGPFKRIPLVASAIEPITFHHFQRQRSSMMLGSKIIFFFAISPVNVWHRATGE